MFWGCNAGRIKQLRKRVVSWKLHIPALDIAVRKRYSSFNFWIWKNINEKSADHVRSDDHRENQSEMILPTFCSKYVYN